MWRCWPPTLAITYRVSTLDTRVINGAATAAAAVVVVVAIGDGGVSNNWRS